MIEECFERHENYGAGQLSGIKSELVCNDTLAVIAIKTNLHLLLQETSPAQELVLQAFVQQQERNGHLFRHEKPITTVTCL
jgi:dsRNA-specific ribonuclease